MLCGVADRHWLPPAPKIEPCVVLPHTAHQRSSSWAFETAAPALEIEARDPPFAASG